MKSWFKKVFAPLVAMISVALSAGKAMAVSVVDATVTGQIADTQTDIITVGTAIIGLAVVAMGIKWVKANFF